MEGYTKQLAQFCSSLEYDAIPENIVKRIKWVILDGLGIIVGATALDFSKTVTEFAKGLGDREEATVLGFGLKSSARNAAFSNGTLGEILEMQDGYTKGGYHPSSGTISSTLAMTEWENKTGKDMITAVVAGYEIGNRVSEAIHPHHLFKGFLPTGSVGGVGAAAAAAKVLGLNEAQTFNALGIAGFITPFTTGDNDFGRGDYGAYTIKPFQGGMAAKSGIESALLAQHGFNGAALEGAPGVQKGFCRIGIDGIPKFEETIKELGEDYSRIETLYFKPYSCCRMNHSVTDIALELKEKHGLKAEEIEEVLVKTYTFALDTNGNRRLNTDSSFMECQFSMPYVVAASLTDGEFGLNQLTKKRIQDPEVHKLAARVKVVADAELDKIYPTCRPAIMEVTTKDGRKLSGRADFAKGDHRKPFTEEEFNAKFLKLTRGVVGEKKANKALDILHNLEKLQSVRELISCLT